MSYLEMECYRKYRALKKGDNVVYKGSNVTFETFNTIYKGRLDTPVGEPGEYVDLYQVAVNDSGVTKIIKTQDVVLEKELPPAEPFDGKCYLSPLPKTKIWEGDTVIITDKHHPHYHVDENGNIDTHFIVNRIKYKEYVKDNNSSAYKVCSDGVVTYASECQLQQVQAGAVRLAYQGEAIKFDNLRNKVEFYALLGWFRRYFNPVSKSYSWDLEVAEKVISSLFNQSSNVKLKVKPHAILKRDNDYWLVSFLDESFGESVMDLTVSSDYIIELD